VARGLSPEQSLILVKALGPAAAGTPPKVDLLARDAIEACFPGLQYWRQRDGSPPFLGSNCWDDQSAELKRAKASISRSFRRLEQRGLVKRLQGAYSRWAGIALTEKGRQIAMRQRMNMQVAADFGGEWRSTQQLLAARAEMEFLD